MDRTFNLALIGAAVTAVLLAVVYGPLVTAFVVAGTSFVLMIGMIAMAAFHSVERWWRGHSWSLHRTRTH
jgi:hypothetical protein